MCIPAMDTAIRSPAQANRPGRQPLPSFVHLKVHSAYSLLEGAITIPKLAKVAAARVKRLGKIFADRLYVEVQRHGLKQEIETEPALLELAYARGLPIVATNEAYFASPDDYEAHDALLCIAEGRYVTEDNRR